MFLQHQNLLFLFSYINYLIGYMQYHFIVAGYNMKLSSYWYINQTFPTFGHLLLMFCYIKFCQKKKETNKK